MSGNPYESRDIAGESRARRRGKPLRWLVQLVVVLGVVVMGIALILPGVRFAPEAARRMQCSNNLKQIALALHNYESVYHCLPPAYTVDDNGQPLHSWRTLILPFMEQQALYDKIDLTKSWDDVANRQVSETRLPAYQCPSSDCPPNHATYLAVVVPGGCFQLTQPRKRSEITDDPDWTLMVVEVDSEQSVPWMSPMDAGEQWLQDFGRVASRPHPGGTQAVCVGGNVRFLSSDTTTTTLRALISIDGNDDDVAQASN